jgi:lysophospholipase L1-like esterase
MRFRSTIACLAFALSGCGSDDASAPWTGADPKDGGTEASAPDGSLEASGDSALPDAGKDAVSETVADAGPDAPAPQGPILYPSDRTHSPITASVAANLEAILARDPASRRDAFMKVGDSISASTAFLNCFAGSAVDLDAHAALQPTLDLFQAQVQGSASFDRTSLSVQSGKTAYWAMTGQPPPLQQEMTATHASVAVGMLGTNDIGWFGTDHVATLEWYHGYMFDLVDTLADAGIIPILSTIPPRDDSASLNAWVPTMNALIRGMAQARQIPLVDFHRELMPLGAHGLGSDGVHPNAYSGGACKLNAAGLAFGYNVRNLISLEALDRVRRAALQGQGALETDASVLAGAGTISDPFVVTGNPFTDLRDSSKATSKQLAKYSGCSSTADESGPETVYKLQVTKAQRLRAMVFDRGDVDVDIHLLGATASEAGCMARDDTIVQADLAPGTYHLSLDTFVSSGVAHGGEYLLVVLLCDPGDAACE